MWTVQCCSPEIVLLGKSSLHAEQFCIRRLELKGRKWLTGGSSMLAPYKSASPVLWWWAELELVKSRFDLCRRAACCARSDRYHCATTIYFFETNPLLELSYSSGGRGLGITRSRGEALHENEGVRTIWHSLTPWLKGIIGSARWTDRKHVAAPARVAEFGRRTGFRIRRGNPWGFESPLSHHNKSCPLGAAAGSRMPLRRHTR